MPQSSPTDSAPPRPHPASVLVVDDEASVRQSLTRWFQEDGYHASAASRGQDALDQVRSGRFDLLVVDLKMPGMDGLELQRRVAEFDPTIIVVMITAHATVDTAIHALKAGAFDYVIKPVDPHYLSHVVRNALRQRELERQNQRLLEQVDELTEPVELVGESPAMQRVHDMIATVARTDTTVMIRGNSGTGKALVARAIHAASARQGFPFVTVSCGPLAADGLEAELCGTHDADGRTRPGKLQMANGGTLFLDEIGNLDLASQTGLMRALDQREAAATGRTLALDVRVIAATHRDLEYALVEGAFREDLFYRLNVFTLQLPPLRERKSDIPLLARHFLARFATQQSKSIEQIDSVAVNAMVRYDWPGNVRELENAIERAMVVGRPPSLRAEDLPFQVLDRPGLPASGSLASVERAHVSATLEAQHWNITRAAEVLQIDRATLYHKIEKYGLRKPA